MADDVVELPPIRIEGTMPPGTPAPGPKPPAGPTPPSDELTVLVDGKVFGGWDEVSLSRSCEAMPSVFSIEMTERYPGEINGVLIAPGLPCVVKMGADVVLTGFIDRYVPALDGKRHSVRVWGRSKAQDLVDCSAVFDTFQISGQTVGQIARTLADWYGIKVLTPDGDGPVVPQMALQLGESPWEIIERLCRFAKFLAYDDPDGNVVLRPLSEEKHASGVKEGVNVVAASTEFSMDERFSEYYVYPLSTNPLFDADRSAGGTGMPYADAIAFDQGVKRKRRRVIILEHTGATSPYEAAQKRAEWEQARRAGRSERITVRVDSWRDSAGKPWAPNTLVDVDVPTLKVKAQTWTLGEVTYLRGEHGTSARLVLMPSRAFDPEYQPRVSYNWQAEESARKEYERTRGYDQPLGSAGQG